MRAWLPPLLLGLLGGCLATGVPSTTSPQVKPLSVPDSDHRPQTDTEPPRGTAFAQPAAYASLLATRSLQSMDASLPDVPGLRLGTFAGLQALLIETPHATAAIALFGGHLLSFVPTGQADVLWVSPANRGPPQPIRGGTPVVWPFFGRQDQAGDVPSHGFVRTMRWQLDAAHREADGTMVLRLSPPVFDDLPLRLHSEFRIGRTLEQRLVTENVGNDEVGITQALHTYFRVSDVERIRVRGLDGLTYLDKNDDYRAHVQRGDWTLQDPRDPGRSDRIYGGAAGEYLLEDAGAARQVRLQVEGSRSLVVWNPGEAAAARSADMQGGLWRDFVCLEAANAGSDVARIAAGATHVLVQRIEVLPLAD